MNDLKKNINLPLLYEIRKDVFAKSGDAEYGERFFSMMHHMDLLARTAGKEGLLALADAAKEIPLEVEFYQDIQSAVSYVCDGLEGEDVMEILTARYWIKNLQGEDALLYFMMILSIIRIQDGAPPDLLESLLMAYLPDDAAEKYTEYKKQYQSARQEQTPLEILLSHDPDIGEGGILVVKRLLEEKIEFADVQNLKGVITEAENTDLVISLKGLSVHARKKLFSVMSDDKADEYAGHCEYMGPVRQIDVLASMSELIGVFEKQERLL
ncbi:hypothetical protein C805_02267 [Eubacterium sp. 14-2]|uniref:FliG C-terminal domain-containing protein n=1 Tax=Eubacterium sp. 14-2 TaxID=1235790 RepID=UPI000337D6A3|nr:FliG C-terminal domain-containing protein [Eubacterium sp. 14-2]EOT24056.1 hypothetical protein C805_02267 [Eubacterium sp. 14-2]